MRGFVSLVSVVTLVACSTASTTQAVDGGADAAPLPDSALCDGQSSDAQHAIAAAAKKATTNVSCTTDADCVWVEWNCSCCGACLGSSALRTDQAAPLRAAIADADATSCKSFADEGCKLPTPHPGCTEQGPTVACLSGACTFGSPTAWVSFSFLDVGPGTGLTFPPSCETGQACSLRTVKSDGSISIVNPTHTAKLSDADFALVDGIMRSESFRTNPAQCGGTSNDPRVGFSEQRTANGGTGFDATGCVDVDGGTTVVAQMYAVVKKY